MFFDKWLYPRIVRKVSRVVSGLVVPSSLFQLNTLVLMDHDSHDEPADACYLFGQTRDNQDCALRRGAELFERGRVKLLVICGNDAGYGYPGVDEWYQHLRILEVPANKILRMPTLSRRHPSTFSEAESLVFYAHRSNWTKIYIIASPHHQLRSFISVVSWVKRLYPELKVYNQPGIAYDWWMNVTHSQGILRGTRADLILDEAAGIFLYRLKGDLVSPHAVIEHLKGRDKC